MMLCFAAGMACRQEHLSATAVMVFWGAAK